MSAPEKIWAWEKPGGIGSVRGWTDRPCESIEYTRTDMIPAMIAEAVAKDREIAKGEVWALGHSVKASLLIDDDREMAVLKMIWECADKIRVGAKP